MAVFYAALALAALYLAAGYAAFSLALVNRYKGVQRGNEQEKQTRRSAMQALRAQGLEDVYLQHRGVLHGYFLDTGADKSVLLAHGYRTDATRRASLAQAYARAGYNVIMADNRGHGLSCGRYVGMGAYEKDDLCVWIAFLNEKFPGAPVVLDGTSMGAASVLLAAAQDRSGSVAAVVEDCGYTSAKEILSHRLGRLWPLGRALFPATNLFCRVLGKFDLREAEPLGAVKSLHMATLFLHGDADRVVPFAMGQRLFEACRAEKEFIAGHGAGHGQTRRDPNCQARAMAFVSQAVMRFASEKSC